MRWGTRPVFPSCEQQADFVRQAVPLLESLSFVERYAWFALPPWSSDGASATTNLYDEAGSPTAVGEANRSLPLADDRAVARDSPGR